jgi:hypothetical protein
MDSDLAQRVVPFTESFLTQPVYAYTPRKVSGRPRLASRPQQEVTEQVDEVIRVRRRQERLREELADACVSLNFDGPIGERALAELDYACFPPRHEREFPTYGALIVGGATPRWDESDLRVTDAEGCSLAGLRLLADGRQSFVLFSRERSDLAVFLTAHDRETALVRLQRDSPQDLVIVQRTSHGVVRAYANRRLVVWDGSSWSESPYADSYSSVVLRSVPEARPAVLSAILDFCIHTIGPAPTGAALVWSLDEGGSEHLGHLRRPAPRVQLPALSLLDPLAHGALRQLLSQIDGVALVDVDGRVVEAGVHLTGSDQSSELVRPRPGRGTRHGSARRFSFDEDRTVVFVVSEDGPITVYSDGGVIASIEEAPEGSVPPDGSEETNSQRVVICGHCGKHCGVEPLGLSPGSITLECPVCTAPIDSPWPDRVVRLWILKARPVR